MASSAGTGYITTASEMSNKLADENRDYNNKKAWSTLYNGNDVAAAQAQQSLTKSYTDSSVDAYVSNLQSQQAIKNSKVVGSSKQQLADAYQAQYQQNASDLYSTYYDYQNQIEESRQETETSITSALEQQAEYSADFTNSHYDYLEYLYENNPELFETNNYSKYTTIDAEQNENGSYVDENGKEISEDEAKELYGTRLKTWQELSAVQKAEGDTLYSSIYDENGNLTTFGTEFFDQMENDFMNQGEYSWNNWLKETNEDLYNWAYNDYNYYNYTAAGTNVGTLKTMYGMMSTDNTYSYLERFGGMTDSQIQVYFDAVDTAVQALQDYIDTDTVKTREYKVYYTHDESLDGTIGKEKTYLHPFSKEGVFKEKVYYVYDPDREEGYGTGSPSEDNINAYGAETIEAAKVDKNGNVKEKSKNYNEKNLTPYMEDVNNAIQDLYDGLGLTPYIDATLEDMGYQGGVEGMNQLIADYCDSLETTWDVILEACINGAIDAAVIGKGIAEVATGAGAVKGVSDIIYGTAMLVVNICSAVEQVGDNKENNKNVAQQFEQQMQQYAVQLTDMKNTFLKNTYNSQYSLLY